MRQKGDLKVRKTAVHLLLAGVIVGESRAAERNRTIGREVAIERHLNNRDSIIEFLKSLQILPRGTRDLVLVIPEH
jgi:hypothetical protein